MKGMEDPKLSKVWMVKQKLLCAKDLLETLKNVNNDMLVNDGFWII